MYAAGMSRESRTTPARLASTAARLGYDGVVLPSADADAAISDAVDIEVVSASRFRPTDRTQAMRAIDRDRTSVDVLCAASGEEAMQRFLAERVRLDVLFPDGVLPHTIAKTARAHGIAIGIDLGPILRTSGTERADDLRERRRLARILTRFDVPFVVTISPPTHLALRAPRDIACVGSRCGFDTSDVERGLARWGAIAQRTRRARDDRFIEPGVRVVDDDTDAR